MTFVSRYFGPFREMIIHCSPTGVDMGALVPVDRDVEGVVDKVTDAAWFTTSPADRRSCRRHRGNHR